MTLGRARCVEARTNEGNLADEVPALRMFTWMEALLASSAILPRKRRRDSDTTQEAPCGPKGFFEVHFHKGRASLKTLPWAGGGGVGGGGGGV